MPVHKSRMLIPRTRHNSCDLSSSTGEILERTIRHDGEMALQHRVTRTYEAMLSTKWNAKGWKSYELRDALSVKATNRRWRR